MGSVAVMDIIIPTYKRTDRQYTFESLPSELQSKVSFIADDKDNKTLYKKYKNTGARFVNHPRDIDSIGKKRAWILQQTQWDKIIMLDDDLRPYARREDGGLKKAGPKAIIKSFRRLDKKLDTYAHAGFSPRLGNNRVEEGGWVENTRMIYTLGYRADIIRAKCLLGRVEYREDMELTLQLLRKGFPNTVLYDLAWEQAGGYDAEGGVSSSRTVEQSNREALKLKELHPAFVNVMNKNYKRSTKRWEVTVYWKKAFASSQKKGGFL